MRLLDRREIPIKSSKYSHDGVKIINYPETMVRQRYKNVETLHVLFGINFHSSSNSTSDFQIFLVMTEKVSFVNVRPSTFTDISTACKWDDDKCAFIKRSPRASSENAIPVSTDHQIAQAEHRRDKKNVIPQILIAIESVRRNGNLRRRTGVATNGHIGLLVVRTKDPYRTQSINATK